MDIHRFKSKSEDLKSSNRRSTIDTLLRDTYIENLNREEIELLPDLRFQRPQTAKQKICTTTNTKANQAVTVSDNHCQIIKITIIPPKREGYRLRRKKHPPKVNKSLSNNSISLKKSILNSKKTESALKNVYFNKYSYLKDAEIGNLKSLLCSMDKKKKKNKKSRDEKGGKNDSDDYEENSGEGLNFYSSSPRRDSFDDFNNSMCTYTCREDKKEGRFRSNQVNFNICVPKGCGGVNVRECTFSNSKEQSQQCDMVSSYSTSSDEPLVVITVYPNKKTTITQNNKTRVVSGSRDSGQGRYSPERNKNSNNKRKQRSPRASIIGGSPRQSLDSKSSINSRSTSPSKGTKKNLKVGPNKSVKKEINSPRTGRSKIKTNENARKGTSSKSNSPSRNTSIISQETSRTSKVRKDNERSVSTNVQHKIKDVSPSRNTRNDSVTFDKNKSEKEKKGAQSKTRDKDPSTSRNFDTKKRDQSVGKNKNTQSNSKDGDHNENLIRNSLELSKMSKIKRDTSVGKKDKGNKKGQTKTKHDSPLIPSVASSYDSEDSSKISKVKRNTSSTQTDSPISKKDDKKNVQSKKRKEISGTNNDLRTRPKPIILDSPCYSSESFSEILKPLRLKSLKQTNSTNAIDSTKTAEKKQHSRININLEARIIDNSQTSKGTNTTEEKASSSQPKSALKTILTKLQSGKNHVSNISLNIDTDAEFYNVLFQQNAKNNKSEDCVCDRESIESMKNLLLTSDCYECCADKRQSSLEISIRQKSKPDIRNKGSPNRVSTPKTSRDLNAKEARDALKGIKTSLKRIVNKCLRKDVTNMKTDEDSKIKTDDSIKSNLTSKQLINVYYSTLDEARHRHLTLTRSQYNKIKKIIIYNRSFALRTNKRKIYRIALSQKRNSKKYNELNFNDLYKTSLRSVHKNKINNCQKYRSGTNMWLNRISGGTSAVTLSNKSVNTMKLKPSVVFDESQNQSATNITNNISERKSSVITLFRKKVRDRSLSVSLDTFLKKEKRPTPSSTLSFIRKIIYCFLKSKNKVFGNFNNTIMSWPCEISSSIYNSSTEFHAKSCKRKQRWRQQSKVSDATKLNKKY